MVKLSNTIQEVEIFQQYSSAVFVEMCKTWGFPIPECSNFNLKEFLLLHYSSFTEQNNVIVMWMWFKLTAIWWINPLRWNIKRKYVPTILCWDIKYVFLNRVIVKIEFSLWYKNCSFMRPWVKQWPSSGAWMLDRMSRTCKNACFSLQASPSCGCIQTHYIITSFCKVWMY